MTRYDYFTADEAELLGLFGYAGLRRLRDGDFEFPKETLPIVLGDVEESRCRLDRALNKVRLELQGKEDENDPVR